HEVGGAEGVLDLGGVGAGGAEHLGGEDVGLGGGLEAALDQVPLLLLAGPLEEAGPVEGAHVVVHLLAGQESRAAISVDEAGWRAHSRMRRRRGSRSTEARRTSAMHSRVFTGKIGITDKNSCQ